MVEDAHGRLPRRTCGMIVNIDTFVCERCVGRVDGDGPQAGGRGRARHCVQGAACGARAEQLHTHLALTDTTLAPTGKFSRM